MEHHLLISSPEHHHPPNQSYQPEDILGEGDRMMSAETANVILLLIAILIFFMLMTACCRQLREGESTRADLHTPPFFISSGGMDSARSLRMVGVFQIHPPPFHLAVQNSSPVYHSQEVEEPPPTYEEYLKSVESIEIEIPTGYGSAIATIANNDTNNNQDKGLSFSSNNNTATLSSLNANISSNPNHSQLSPLPLGS